MSELFEQTFVHPVVAASSARIRLLLADRWTSEPIGEVMSGSKCEAGDYEPGEDCRAWLVRRHAELDWIDRELIEAGFYRALPTVKSPTDPLGYDVSSRIMAEAFWVRIAAGSYKHPPSRAELSAVLLAHVDARLDVLEALSALREAGVTTPPGRLQ